MRTTLQIRDRRLASLCILLTGECVAFFLCFAGYIGVTPLAFLHLGVLTVFAILARASFQSDLTLFALTILLGTYAGPFAILGAIAVELLLSNTRVQSKNLEAWYDRISGVANSNSAILVYDKIIDGRARSPRSSTVDIFASVLEGPLETQQALLGLIGLDYHSDYKEVLKKALASTEPSIRVHAAAVSVKLRTRARSEYQQLLSTPCSESSASQLASYADRLMSLADGGFLDRDDRARALQRADALCLQARTLDPYGPKIFSVLSRVFAAEGRWSDLLLLLDEAPVSKRPAEAWRLRDRALMELGRAKELHRHLVSRGTGPIHQSGVPHVA